MNTLDPARIATLAAQLQLAPRQLLALAARISTQPDLPLDAMRLEVEIARVHAAADAAHRAADLALLGYAAFALDDIERGLALAWSPTQARGL